MHQMLKGYPKTCIAYLAPEEDHINVFIKRLNLWTFKAPTYCEDLPSLLFNVI